MSLLCGSRCPRAGLSYSRLKWLIRTGHARHYASAVIGEATKEPNKLYTDTVLLPKTTFPLHHEPRNELDVQKTEAFCNLYDRQRRDPERSEEFVLHDGPPYANGNTHLGHAVNKILKDIICRYKIAQGHKVHYVPGWDCHGLPIELKAVDSAKAGQDPVMTRQKAANFALQTIDLQKTAFKRWGVIANWNNCYVTFDKDYVVGQLRAFNTLYENGLIYKDYLPVYWSMCHETALAEAELEYNASHVSQSVYVKLKIMRSTLSSVDNERLYALIWTTTPWTLPSNQAVAFAEGKTYAVVTCDKSTDQYIVAQEMIEELSKSFNKEFRVIQTFESSYLKEMTYAHPTKPGSELPLLDGGHVTMTKGTGLVHTAPNHGKQDYVFATRHKLNLEPCAVNEKGYFTSDAGPGLANKFVLSDGTEEVLRQWSDNIVHKEDFEHSYPYDWRSKKPVIVRASQQWFMNIDRIRGQCIDVLDKTTFYPESFKRFLRGQLEERPQWCISRQRSWGVPIPAFYRSNDKDTSDPIMTTEIFEHLERVFKEHGTDAWWQFDTEKLLPDSMKSENLTRGRDILDIWFDSGISWQNVLPEPKVADMYLEGYDQLRGWFQSSLITSVALRGCAPYKSVFIHGFTVDENGKKMSKSEGNVVDPSHIVDGKGKGKSATPANGADVLRWWVFSFASDHTNVKFAQKRIDAARERVKKIRGLLRFVLGALNNFESSKLVPYKNLLDSDKLFLNRLSRLDKYLQKCLKNYDFENMSKALGNFVMDDMSTFYCMVTKHRLYCYEEDSLARHSCQSTYWHILDRLRQYLSPILPHLMEEYYQHFPETWRTGESVFEMKWQPVQPDWRQQHYSDADKLLSIVIDTVFKRLPTAKMPDHEMVICAKVSDLDLLRMFQKEPISINSELCDLLRVAKVTLNELSTSQETLDGAVQIPLIRDIGKNETDNFGQVLIRKASGATCPRCRRKVSQRNGQPCEKCLEILASSYKS